MNRYFCTYFDHRYLSRGLAMYFSLKQQVPTAQLWVLCLSNECHSALEKLAYQGLIPISLADFERGDDALQAAKKNRSQIEYYFTCTPSLPLFILRNNPHVDLITYVDSDLYFFKDPEAIFTEMASSSISLIPHRFPPQHRALERAGIFNVGWLSFRRDEEGLACLTWWRDRCIEWCHDYVEEDRFADQKYLNQFPRLFKNLRVIQHKGANLATWNLGNYALREHDGILFVDDQPVLFFHFHGLRKIAPGVVDPSVNQFGLRLSWTMEWKLFRPYIRKLKATQALVDSLSTSAGSIGGLHRKVKKNDAGPQPSYAGAAYKFIRAYCGLVTRRFLLSPGT